jgi:hypothetical protein
MEGCWSKRSFHAVVVADLQVGSWVCPHRHPDLAKRERDLLSSSVRTRLHPCRKGAQNERNPKLFLLPACPAMFRAG